MFLVSKQNHQSITYFIAEDIFQALSIYEREKDPLVKEYGTTKGYIWDNRTLENGEVVETTSSFNDDEVTLRISLQTSMEASVNFYTQVHDITGQVYEVIDERD